PVRLKETSSKPVWSEDQWLSNAMNSTENETSSTLTDNNNNDNNNNTKPIKTLTKDDDIDEIDFDT
ncbi:unnamed protein product, partial [Rotaria magnacalcarata]